MDSRGGVGRFGRRIGAVAGATAVLLATMVGADTVIASRAGAVSPLTPGDLIVYRVGTGTGSLGSGATAVYLDEYSQTGALVESVAMPTASSGPVNALTASGSATSEGQLSLSADGSAVVATGYDAPPGTASVSGTTSTAAPRTVGLLGASGAVDTSTALTDAFSVNNVRGATSTDGTHLWVSGADAAAGVRAATVGASTSTALVSSTYKNFRAVEAVDGQLYGSADPTKAQITVATIGTGTPTSGINTVANLPFSTSPTSPYGFAFLTLGSGTAPDTAYVADNGAGAVIKYSLQNGQWVATGTVAVPNVVGVTAQDVNGVAHLFATSTVGTDGQLYAITDASGQGGTLTGNAVQLAAAKKNESFRGIAFAPGTVIGSGGAPPPVVPTVTPADLSLAAALGDPTNASLGLTVGDAAFDPSQLTVTATTSDPTVAASATVTGSGASRALVVTPGDTVGYATITVTATAPDDTSSSVTVTYGLSANLGDPTQRYYSGAGNASSVIDAGGGYLLAADDLSDVIRLYQAGSSGPPVKTFDFTGQLPYGATTMDLEAAARSGNTIYWLGSQSNNDNGAARPAADTLFATTITGSGASASLSYVGSYTGLRQDLISWDEANGNRFALAADSQGGAKSVNGFNIEGLEFAPGSTSTAYLAFRAPLEDPTNPSDALVVPVTNIDALVTNGNPGTTAATFGQAMEWNLGGLGIRELRANAAGEYLVLAGTPDGTDSVFRLYSWDGVPTDHPVVSPTPLAELAGGAWESILTPPASLVTGGAVELVEDNGDTAWYGDITTSKSGLPTGLQKDVGQTFNFISGITPPTAPTSVQASASTDGSGTLSVNWAPPADDNGTPVTGYVVTATPQGGGTPLTQSFDSTGSSATFAGAVGTAYAVTVVALNQAGTGAVGTAPGGPFIPSHPSGPPRAVAGIAGTGQVVVTWQPPADSGGLPVTSYVVTASGGAGGTCTTTTTACTVTGLTNWTSYTFTVVAVTDDGPGATSVPSGRVTPEPPGNVVVTARAPTLVVAAGHALQDQIRATGSPLPTISTSGPLPSWVTFMPGPKPGRPAKLGGKVPADAGGTYSVVVLGSNSTGLPTALVVTIEVLGFTSAASASFTGNQPGSFTVATSHTPADPVLAVSGLPTGLTFVDNGDGTGTIAGTPAAATKSHTYHVHVTATSGSVTAHQTVALTVAAGG